MRIGLKIQLWSVQVGLENRLHLLYKKHWVLRIRVQPILTSMGLKIGVLQITADLTDRDRGDDLSLNDFVG